MRRGSFSGVLWEKRFNHQFETFNSLKKLKLDQTIVEKKFLIKVSLNLNFSQIGNPTYHHWNTD